jgi:hypothetical protein
MERRTTCYGMVEASRIKGEMKLYKNRMVLKERTKKERLERAENKSGKRKEQGWRKKRESSKESRKVAKE